ncbi:MAG: S8 family serine peptidase, partial [Verrucomicrobia subdivision 3 bacterium]|nr:S8 family serine peptidase [Limisphaerales bacterium]
MLVVAVTSAAADAQASLKKRSDNARVTRYRGGPEIAQQVAFSFDAGDSYPSSTGPRALKRLAGLISVTLSSAGPTGSAIQELTGLGGPFEGYAVESRVRHGRVILSGSAAQRRAQVDNPQLRSAALATARKIRGVVSANPVFMDPKTGRRLVLAQGVVVKLKPGAESSGSLAGASFRQLAGTTDQFIIDLPAATAEEIFQEVSRRARQPQIEWAEPDMIPQMVKHFVPNDPLFSQQWHLRNLGVSPQRNDADIDASEAWDTSRGSTNIVIAILDDGVELDHPDLSPNIFRNPGEVLNNIDDDGNGYVDDIRGWDFFDIDNDPNPVFFDDTHGTAVAGVAVAVADNGLGVAGSGFSCRLLPIRMVGVSLSEAAQAVYYAAGRGSDGVSRWRGADIISISLGFPQSAVTDAAFAWAATNGRNGNGCPIFVASGNEASLWHTVELSDIGAGLHTYEWVFVKDESISEGEDTVWLDGIVFPDKAIQSFESPLLPNGFSTFGNAPWFSVQDGVGNNHALTGWSGQNARAIRSGDISDNQTSGLRTSRFYARTGSLVFSAWVSAEFDDNFYFDRLDFLLDGVREFSIDGDPLAPIFVELDYPASHPDTIAVGACTDFDFRADYSCYAGDLDFVAPSDGGFSGIVTTDLLG